MLKEYCCTFNLLVFSSSLLTYYYGDARKSIFLHPVFYRSQIHYFQYNTVFNLSSFTRAYGVYFAESNE